VLQSSMQRLLQITVCLAVFLACRGLRAQQNGPAVAPEPAKTAPETRPAPAGPIEESKLPVYLKSKDGRLVPMLDWSLEDFERVYQENQGLKQRDQAPPFGVQSISATGTVKGDYADLTLQAAILVRDEQWVRVPLRLNQAVLREGARHEGTAGQSILEFEAEGDGYISRLRGTAGQQHRLTLPLLVPIVKIGEECRLKLSFPKATSSSLKLTVPMNGAVGEVSSGATLSSSALGQKGTEFSILGLTGDFELRWRPGDSRLADTEPVLEAVGAILARVESGVVHSEAVLTVRGYGAVFDRFHVRLPEGAELVPAHTSEYSVVSATESAAQSKDRLLAEVRLAKKAAGPVEVRIATRRRYESGGWSGWFELAGFEVLEAARQWGNIAVAAAEDLQVLCMANRGVRQADQLPESLRGDDRVAGYTYFSQPCSLTARVVPRKTRVIVEPEYLVLVDEEEVRLEAKLKYNVRAARVTALDVELLDWQLDDVGPANLVAVDMVAVSQTGTLTIPFAAPSIGQIEVTIRAHQKIKPDASSLSIALPRPQANSLGSAAVVVLPADNIELAPDAKATVGLVRQQVAPPMKLPPRQQAPLFYRGETSKAVFAADRIVHPQSITVDVASRLTLSAREKRVEQKLTYAIAYQPLDTVTLDVPRELAAQGALEVLCDGEPVPAVDLPLPDATGPTSKSMRKRVVLPASRIGNCELTIRYPVTLEELLPETTVVSTIPLVMPVEGKLARNRLCVSLAPGVQVLLREGPWAVAQECPASTDQDDGLQLVADRPTDRVVLGIQLEDRDGLGSTVVERAWVQTWIASSASGARRQDRAVFRFASDQRELDLILPSGVDPDDVEVMLDRRRVAARKSQGGRFTIPLPEEGSSAAHTLEAYYHFVEPVVEVSRWPLELPRLGRNVWIRRMYWQLVLPHSEHVIAAPSGFTPEFAWGWCGTFWGRKPLLEQAQLENWSGSARLTAVPAATSRYLFSAFGPVEQCELRVASRSLIVLGASGAALVAGLVLIYLPFARRAPTLLLTALVLAGAAFLSPELALLIAQAASVGVALALVAGLLQRGVARRRRRLMPRNGANGLLEKGSTQTLHRAPVARPEDSTDTAPEIAPAPTTDAHP